MTTIWQQDDYKIMMTILVYSPTQCICCWGQMQRSWCRICDPGTQPRMTCPAEKGERLEVCKGRRIKGTEKQEEEAEGFVEAGLHYEGREGLLGMKPKLRGLHNEDGDKTCQRWSHRYSGKLQRGEFSVQEKMGPGHQWTRKTKKGPKKEKRTRQRGNFEEEPEYPKPWQRGGVHIRQSQDISHPQTWNKRDVKRVQLSALCCHEKTFHYGTLSSAVIP